ncbi:alpha/beta fold hydrolase [Luteimonas sp. A478]
MNISKAVVGVLAWCCINALPASASSFEACADSTSDASLSSSTCVVTEVPLDPVGDRQGAVDIFVRQFQAPDESRRRGQVWLIAGGPGEAGASLYPFVPVFRQAFPDYDLIVPDHRGTGDSTRLCPAQEKADSPAGYGLADEEWGPCIGALYADTARTRAFNVTNAAHDLSALIERFREPGEVYVYGVSYGTQMVLRMMQVAAPELDGLVLDGLVPPESESRWDLSHRTSVVDAVGRNTLTGAQIERYTRVLAMDPAIWQATLPGGDLRQLMGTLLNFPALRDRVPALIDSLLEGRTDLLAITIADLEKEHARITPYPQSAPSLPLVMLISASENNDRRDLTVETVVQEEKDALFTSPTPRFLASSPLPLYDRDQYFGRSPGRLPRTLVIHGTLDPNTPYSGARTHADALSSAGEIHFSTIARGAHVLPLVAPECFGNVVAAFISGEHIPEHCASQ